MDANDLGILLSVGPDGAGDRTLDFAAAEALDRGTGVELLHVVRSAVALPAYPGQIQALDQSLLAVGRSVLTDAARRLRTRLGDRVPTSSTLLAGPVVPTILDHAAGRELVVTERRAESVGRLLTMSVSSRVAARSPAPVAVVPHGWAPPSADLPVVVGVDDPHAPEDQVQEAAAYAATVGRDVVVLYALWLPETYRDALDGRARRAWVHEADRALDKALVNAGRSGGSWTRRVRWGRPAEALVDESERAAVVVMSRRLPHRPSAHLGPVTRSVLRHARCPVLVVDRTADPDAGGETSDAGPR